MRAAKSVCLNIAEGAGRVSVLDKRRVFAIARGEAVETIAAVEIAAACGETTARHRDTCLELGKEVVAILGVLSR